jgi:hypothetical protein
MSETAISQLVAGQGVTHASVLAFVRECDTSVAIDILDKFNQWVEGERTAGHPVDEDLVASVQHDLEVHHRLTPETIIGAPHAPYISLNHTEDNHFGRN